MTNLAVQQVRKATESVWVQFNFGPWAVLIDWNGDTFDDMDLAKDFIRNNFKTNVGLASFDQALMNNSEWDNL